MPVDHVNNWGGRRLAGAVVALPFFESLDTAGRFHAFTVGKGKVETDVSLRVGRRLEPWIEGIRVT
jgi:hypothetical protein